MQLGRAKQFASLYYGSIYEIKNSFSCKLLPAIVLFSTKYYCPVVKEFDNRVAVAAAAPQRNTEGQNGGGQVSNQ